MNWKPFKPLYKSPLTPNSRRDAPLTRNDGPQACTQCVSSESRGLALGATVAGSDDETAAETDFRHNRCRHRSRVETRASRVKRVIKTIVFTRQ